MAHPRLFIIPALVALTVAAYWQVGQCGFVAYDDPSYVSGNPMVNQGLRAAAVCWAFTSVHGANWHPLASLSHMFDCTLFGLNAGAHHWMNLFWHALNGVAVFLVWRRLSGATWPSAFVAALFALHPLHVESVAWISERKDVLSTAFWLVTLAAYAWYVERPGWRRYALVISGLTLGLMAKPMVVTLPVTLLLIDYWPLRRWPQRSWGALIWEKLPLFGLVAASGVVTLVVQHGQGAMDFGDRFSLPMRLCNAVVSLARYPVKMFAPVGLSAFYPHPGWWPWWEVAGATAIVGAVTWLAWRERARRGWLLFGWGWYVVTLLPVIGIAQVGAHSIADRYTYVPLLGIFTILAWAGAEVVQRSPGWRAPLAAAAGLALAACLVRTMWQVPVWRDGITLVENMRSAVGRHPVVHRAMAQALATAGRPERDVIAEYRSGLELDPRNPHFLTQLGNAAAGAGKFDEALSLLGQARDIVPADATAWYNLGVVSARAGRLEDAIRFGRKAIERRPRMGPAHWLLAQVFEGQGRRLDTCAALREAIDCNRWDWVAWNDLGIAYAGLKRPADSLACFERAHWIHPGEKDIARNLAEARKRAGGSGR